MFNADFIESIAKRLSDAIPPGLQAFKADFERNCKVVLQNAFAKLDLVTREEFDAQAGVLAKTRAKLEVLEQEVAKLEAVIATKNSQSSKKPKK